MGAGGNTQVAARRGARRYPGKAADRRPHKIGGLSMAEFMLAEAVKVSRPVDGAEGER